VGFGDGQVADGVPYDEGIPIVSTAFTSACRSDDGKRLEEARRRRASGARFPASQNQQKASRDAPGHGKDNGTRERRRGTGSASDSMVHRDGCCGLRQAIPAAWGRFESRYEWENGEETVGFL
jgi:hypothetical protein